MFVTNGIFYKCEICAGHNSSHRHCRQFSVKMDAQSQGVWVAVKFRDNFVYCSIDLSNFSRDTFFHDGERFSLFDMRLSGIILRLT